MRVVVPASSTLALVLCAALFGACGGGSATSTGTGGQTTTSGDFTTSSVTGTTGTGTTGTTSTGGGASTSSSGAGGQAATSASSGTSSSSGAGGGAPAGDCAVDADCPGGACVHITPGGFRVCQIPPQKATTCNAPGLDQCCAGMPCPNDEPCYTGPLVPICAGVVMAPYNQCAVDQCGQDGDCAAQQICGLAGALGADIRACLAAACKVDGDCAAMAGGRCEPVEEPCCGTIAGLFCVYPNGGCRTNADCGPMGYCQAVGPNARCQAGVPACPR